MSAPSPPGAASGTYGIGAVFSITVNFSTVVAVTGTPELALNSGGSASYSSGSGSKGLVFSYTVSAGNAATALDYSSTSALSLNGGTIVQASLAGGTNNASLTLPTLGAGSSLSPGKTIVIDTAAPSVSSVTSSAASGTYGFGTVFSITVNFSTVVAVTGTPELALNSGGSASYSSGSGSKGLVFSYTVSTGNAATALDYSSTSALSLNGGTIVQAGLMGGTNNASLTLPTLGAGSSLSPGKTIVIDTTAPSVSSVSTSAANGTYGIGAVFSITVSFSKAVAVTGKPTLSLNSGGTASYSSGSGSAALVFSYTVSAGECSSALDYTGISALTLNSGTIVQSRTPGGH